MSKEKEDLPIPIVHARIHAKIEERAKGNIVDYKLVKEWVGRMIIKKGAIPRCDINPTIEDMCNLNLLKRIARLKYQVLKNKDKHRLRKPVF